MAKSYQQLWEEQKKKGVYQTTSGGKVYASESARQADKAVQEAVQSAAAQKASGSLKTTSGGTVKTTPKATTSNTYVPKTTGVTVPSVLAPTASFVPTVQPVKTKPVNVKTAINAVDGSNIAAEAYRRKLAAANANNYNNEFEDIEIVSADQVTTPNSASIATVNGGTRQGGTYISDIRNWAGTKSPNEIVVDIYGNRIRWGDLQQLIANGYYDNWREKSDTMDGTPYTYGYQYAVGNGGNVAAYDGGGYEALAKANPNTGYGDSLPSYAQSIIDAQNAQYAALLQQLRNQSGVLNQQYDANAADLYELYRRGQLAFPELMSGTATGMADSFSLQSNLNFQNNLAANELERATAQNELNAQANQIRADSELQAAQTAAEWAQMMYQQRQQELAAEREYRLDLAKAQNKTSGTSTTEKSDDYAVNTVPETKQYLELQLGMGNNMTAENIMTVLKDMYKAKAISKALAVATAAEYGISLYL